MAKIPDDIARDILERIERAKTKEELLSIREYLFDVFGEDEEQVKVLVKKMRL